MTQARGRERAPGDGVGALAADVLHALTRDTDDAGDALVRVLERGRTVLGARWASIVVRRGDALRVVASTDEVGDLIAGVQVEAGTGPVVDALAGACAVVTGDLTCDARWPTLVSLLPADPEPRGLAALPLDRGDRAQAAALVVGSDRRAAFPAPRLARARVLASSLGLLLDAREALEDAAGLRRSLDRDREVGMAMGIVMASHRLTRDQALGVLRAASREADGGLADVVAEVVDGGRVPRASPGGR